MSDYESENFTKNPKMILFDYGETLVHESAFDGVKGTAAVMKYAVENKYNKTPEQIQATADVINSELGRFDSERKHLFQIEVSNIPFYAYLYESQGIKLSISYEEAEKIFFANSAPGIATDGVEQFLRFLKKQGIRTSVISNISYGSHTLRERLNRILPQNEFEFIIASSEYVFRKPNRRIFDLALEKANLKPQDAWYIGDYYACDIMGAMHAGLFPVWYTKMRTFEQSQDTTFLQVESWLKLEQIIGECI